MQTAERKFGVLDKKEDKKGDKTYYGCEGRAGAGAGTDN